MDRLIGLALCAGPVQAQTDKYFTNTSRIVAANGDSRVTFAVFMRRRVVAALEPAIRLVRHFVPDVEIKWRDVWMGAAFTALLFTIGKLLLGLCLGRASVASPYGAAGSIIVLVIWVYYATQILFMGAEFTQVYARAHGAQLVPSKHAVPADEPSGASPA